MTNRNYYPSTTVFIKRMKSFMLRIKIIIASIPCCYIVYTNILDKHLILSSFFILLSEYFHLVG